ncbi:hypothetical protein Droror1_Dr00024939 [Drosera rotundifolia]
MLSPRVKSEEAVEMMMLSNESLKSGVDDGVCCNETKFSCIRDDKATETNWYQQGHGELEALTTKGVLRNFEVFADEISQSDVVAFVIAYLFYVFNCTWRMLCFHLFFHRSF